MSDEYAIRSAERERCALDIDEVVRRLELEVKAPAPAGKNPLDVAMARATIGFCLATAREIVRRIRALK